MTPTLVGRWQTRLLLLSTVGLAVTVGYSAWFARGGSGAEPLAPLRLLGWVALLGLLWDALYSWLQEFRWDGDWPWAFHVVAGVAEGVTLFLLLRAGALPGVEYQDGDGLRVAAHYGSVWVLASCCQLGPLRALWPRWRFTGGRILPLGRPARAGARPARARSRLALVAAAALAATLLGSGCGPPAPASTSESSPSLAALLDEGGFVVALAAGEAARPGEQPGPCSPSALAADDRARARAIGAALAQLRPPLARIVIDEDCGAEATAEQLRDRLAAALAPVRLQVETAAVVAPSGSAPPAASEGQFALRRALSSAPPPGANVVVVTGEAALRAATGLDLAEGDGAIFRPAHPGALFLVNRVDAHAWSALDERAAPRVATELPS